MNRLIYAHIPEDQNRLIHLYIVHTPFIYRCTRKYMGLTFIQLLKWMLINCEFRGQDNDNNILGIIFIEKLISAIKIIMWFECVHYLNLLPL